MAVQIKQRVTHTEEGLVHVPWTMMRSLPIWMKVKHQAGRDINRFFILYSPSSF